MCGICAEFRKDDHSPDLRGLEAMVEDMVPRGPDSMGMAVHRDRAFGHRRLSIIDLSDHGHQPMVDNALGLTIVYNGEIYNYASIRDDLIAKGYAFFSHSDTEVLLKGFHCWGADLLQKLNGMFAFVLWDRESGTTFVARDRLGIKPLYVAEDPARIRFCSSLPGLLKAGGIDTDLDPVALNHYMSFHSVVPPPRTILKGVKKFPPGHFMRLEADGSHTLTEYWHPVFEPREDERGLAAEEWEAKILDALRRAVERRLVADVPVGCLLSGGVDSSLIVGLLAEAGQTGLHTFSIGFDTVGEEKGDEFQYSDLIAEHFATRHHKLRADGSRTLSTLAECVRRMSEPMVSHDVIAFYMLSREVARHVKVVQSGQGADEIFGGYHWYPPMMESRDPVADYARVFRDRDFAEYQQAVHPDLIDSDHSLAFIRDHFARAGADSAIDKALRIDTRVMLIDDPVKRVDNTSMSWGLEARVPFLDHELVELAARVPAEFKIEGGGKTVLKNAARKVIPSEVIDRPKGYFPVPGLKYIQGEYLEFIRDILDARSARERTLFQRDYVDTLLADPEGHITPLRGSKLWQVALLEFWLREHNL